MKQQMLAGIKVLDFSTDMAGALAGALLADYGADVVKIERPGGGDPLRAVGPFAHGVSLTHAWFNRGKKSVIVDLETPQGVALVKTMYGTTDIVIENFTPGVMDDLGIGYQAASAIKPDVIYCAITYFGQNGIYSRRPANDLVAQAFSGLMHITGDADGQPMKHGIPVADEAGGLNGFASIVTALASREFSGEGQFIDVANTQILIWMNSLIDRQNFEGFPRREGNHHQSLSPYGMFTGNNGQSVVICGLNAKIWDSLCTIMDRADLKSDPEFNILANRTRNRQKVVASVEEWLRSFPDIQQAVDKMQAAGVPCGLVSTVQDVLVDPHVNHPDVQWLIQVESPDSLKAKGMPTYLGHTTSATFSGVPGKVGKAPDYGQHTEEVLGRYGVIN